jgi:hypothetical protein
MAKKKKRKEKKDLFSASTSVNYITALLICEVGDDGTSFITLL